MICRKMFRKIQYSWKIVSQNTDFFTCLRKIQYNRKNVPHNTESKNGYSANYSFLKIVLHILLRWGPNTLFSQITAGAHFFVDGMYSEHKKVKIGVIWQKLTSGSHFFCQTLNLTLEMRRKCNISRTSGSLTSFDPSFCSETPCFYLLFI